MNDDGRKDLLIARSTAKKHKEKNLGELIWLEQPAEGALDEAEWTEHFICNGPDIYTSINVDSDDDEVVVWAS